MKIIILNMKLILNVKMIHELSKQQYNEKKGYI